MGEVSRRAQLIDASSFDARSQIAATLSREEIEEALRVQEVPELVLEIDRRSNGDVEAHMLRVAWAEDQLRELLRDTSGDDITLYFDPSELEQALVEEDIEAHGMRETTAAVLSVAAIAAGVGAGASPASAMVDQGGTGAGSTIEMVSDAASSGVATAPELVSDAASSGVPASGPELISDSASSGPSGVQVAEASGPELISDSASGGPSGVQVAEASGPELVSDAASTGARSPTQSPSLAGAVSATGTDSGLSGSEIAGAAAVGGLALMITAAGFAVRGKHRREQPA
jgi:hypothetical protein